MAVVAFLLGLLALFFGLLLIAGILAVGATIIELIKYFWRE